MILDSNVLIALFRRTHPELLDRLAEWRMDHAVYINTVIFAETAPGFKSKDGLIRATEELGIGILEISLSEAFRAGQAFAEYRRRGGERQAILPDFFIGAQAEMRGVPLVTRDRRGFASYFPELELIDPLEQNS